MCIPGCPAAMHSDKRMLQNMLLQRGLTLGPPWDCVVMLGWNLNTPLSEKGG